MTPRTSDVIFSSREEEEDTVGNVVYREMIDKYQNFFNSLFFEQPKQKMLCECIVDGMLNCIDLSPRFLRRRSNNVFVELDQSEATEMTFQLLLIRQKEDNAVDNSSDDFPNQQVGPQPPLPLSPTNNNNTTITMEEQSPSITQFDVIEDDDGMKLSTLPIEDKAGESIVDTEKTSPASSSLTAILMEVWKKNADEKYQNGTLSTGGDESLQNSEEADKDLTPLPFSEDDNNIFPVNMDAATSRENADDVMDTDDDDAYIENDDLTPLPLNCATSYTKIQFDAGITEEKDLSLFFE